MRKFLVIRKDGTKRVVTILFDRASKKWCFVNLTTGHVCACRFESFIDALKDMKANENVKEFHQLPEELNGWVN